MEIAWQRAEVDQLSQRAAGQAAIGLCDIGTWDSECRLASLTARLGHVSIHETATGLPDGPT
jgi:hypothetical protein